MRVFASLLLACCWLAYCEPVSAEEGYQDLFNGKDLTGWDGNPELWSVKDGVITGKTDGQLRVNQFLVWTGGKVADFELKLEFRFEGNSNSGVQYRSQRRPDIGDWVVAGYQADIHPNPPYTAMLYDERGRGIIAQRGQKVVLKDNGQKEVTPLGVPVEPVDLAKWHELTLIGKGEHITHLIDGVKTIEVVDEQKADRELEGVIAFQLHTGPAATAQFRNIRLKQLKEPNAQAVPAESANPKWVFRETPTGEKAPPADKPTKAFLRKPFTVNGPLKSAKFFVAADDRVKVSLNGKEVTDHSGPKTATYIDVTGLLQNLPPNAPAVLAIEVEKDRGVGATLARLELESADGNIQKIVTDETWQAAPKSAAGWNTPDFKADDWKPAHVVAALGQKPYPLTEETLQAALKLKTPEATPIERLVVAKGFKVERIYSVPKLVEGSWVSMCVDPKGRLIVCDQYGGLFRVTPPGINGAKELLLEPINVPMGEAQGLLWAFDSLYVVVNKATKYESGVYRVTDANNDDQLDTVETLRLLPGSGGEHGPHAAVLSPDGQSIYIVCGNKTDLTEFAAARVPKIWDEDMLLPRIYGKGFMKGVPAPGGYISKMSPDGKSWELVTAGFRNPYDAAFNADGELFTFDADMEWDINTPWYRPTRVCQVLSGADYGWRNGSAKFPEYFPDTSPPVVNIGPGSPTGVTFGYGAKFPAKYQRAFFISDWSYGKLFAVHMEPQGASYRATVEEFITGTPLPLTDIVINPADQAMYFAIGGRKVQSGLYKVTYVGDEATAAVDGKSATGSDERDVLHKLQALHLGDHPEAVEVAWPYLGSNDPVLRTAARTAIEFRPAEEWVSKAMNAQQAWTRIEGLLAMCRVQPRKGKNPKEAIDTPPPAWDGTTETAGGAESLLQIGMFTSLGELDWQQLTLEQRLAGLRVLQLAMLRFGAPDPMVRDTLLDRLGSSLPTKNANQNAMLLDLLVYLQSPVAAQQGMALLQSAPSQEEQINYAKALSYLRTGWTPELREAYFKWFLTAANYRGGVGFDLFVKDIRETALANLTEAEKESLKPILDQAATPATQPVAAPARPFVKEWKLEELASILQNDLHQRDFEKGRQMFGAANCFGCHRFNGEGGALGPDLTGLAGRFDVRAILESILEPSKVISDQYAAVQILTIDGKVVIGRIVNLHGEALRINTNMLDPNAVETVEQRKIEEMIPAKTSMMPQGLLNTLNQDEVLDLMAFLLSRGDRNNPMFKATAQR